MRAAVLDRDGHCCQWPGCGATHDLEVHHRVPIEDAPALARELSNQITLCRLHHVEAARQYEAR